MSSKQYTDEFRAEAVKQVLERGFTVVDVAARIGIPVGADLKLTRRADLKLTR
ncbi:MAG TPA: transposase, partial [Luteimonas sp.]|nr:transposase [Luteimonas sp.]HRP71847.1 transposase [Luteimonas sp.]